MLWKEGVMTPGHQCQLFMMYDSLIDNAKDN